MSIARVAHAANVSYTTAWRIINNQSCRSPEAIEAVRQAMSRIGYSRAESRRGRPRKAADGIRTHNIALLHFRPGTSISTSILASVQRMLGERNLNLIFAHVEHADALPQAVRSGNVDGVLGYGEFPNRELTPAVQRIPAVWMMSRWTEGTTDAWGDRVKPDHQAIGCLAAQYLLGRGHQHVAYFNPAPDQRVYNERELAFRAAAERGASSLTVMRAEVLGDDGDKLAAMDRAAEDFVAKWRQASPRPTGVFVPVDRVTLRVYRHLLLHHIQPRRDLEIISCDKEDDLLSLMKPAPVSIDLNRQSVARMAVERLLWRMRHGNGGPSVSITVSPVLAPAAHGDWCPDGKCPHEATAESKPTKGAQRA